MAGSPLTACSTNPLPEDVTGLPIYQIVHRIQCEAAQTVRASYYRRGFSSLDAENTRVEKLIAATDKKVSAEEALLAKNNYFGTTESELEDARASIRLQLLQVAEAAARVVSPERNRTDTVLQLAELDRLEQEKKQLPTQLGVVRAAQDALRRKRKFETALKAARSEFEKGGSLCDFVRFMLNAAVFEFEFEVTEDNNATSNGTITWPITLGTIKLVIDVGEKKQRVNKRTVKVASTFAELIDEKKHNCWDVAVSDEARFPRRYPITGSIGLDEVISDYLIVAGGKGRKFDAADGKSYFNTITFTTTINGGLNPSISLTKRMGQLIDANVDLDVSRKDMHKVTIYLKGYEGAKKPDATPEIIIKQMPAVRTRSRIIRQQPTG